MLILLITLELLTVAFALSEHFDVCKPLHLNYFMWLRVLCMQCILLLRKITECWHNAYVTEEIPCVCEGFRHR